MYYTAAQFAAALRKIPEPGGSQKAFLQAHSDAASRALTATMLGKAVAYQSYRPINLLYGKMARIIGAEMGVSKPNLQLLCEFLKPGLVTNREWVLIMRSEFQEGLRRTKWIL